MEYSRRNSSSGLLSSWTVQEPHSSQCDALVLVYSSSVRCSSRLLSLPRKAVLLHLRFLSDPSGRMASATDSQWTEEETRVFRCSHSEIDGLSPSENRRFRCCLFVFCCRSFHRCLDFPTLVSDRRRVSTASIHTEYWTRLCRHEYSPVEWRDDSLEKQRPVLSTDVWCSSEIGDRHDNVVQWMGWRHTGWTSRQYGHDKDDSLRELSSGSIYLHWSHSRASLSSTLVICLLLSYITNERSHSDRSSCIQKNRCTDCAPICHLLTSSDG